jgi:hypothetical protein
MSVKGQLSGGVVVGMALAAGIVAPASAVEAEPDLEAVGIPRVGRVVDGGDGAQFRVLVECNSGYTAWVALIVEYSTPDVDYYNGFAYGESDPFACAGRPQLVTVRTARQGDSPPVTAGEASLSVYVGSCLPPDENGRLCWGWVDDDNPVTLR